MVPAEDDLVRLWILSKSLSARERPWGVSKRLEKARMQSMMLFSLSLSSKPLEARMSIMFEESERNSATAGVAAARRRRRSRTGRRWEGGQFVRM